MRMIMAEDARAAGPLGADRGEQGCRVDLEAARGIGGDIRGGAHRPHPFVPRDVEGPGG